MRFDHQVVKRSLNDGDMTLIIVVAGTGFPGSAFNQLDQPMGIFVDLNFDLYIADSCKSSSPVMAFRRIKWYYNSRKWITKSNN